MANPKQPDNDVSILNKSYGNLRKWKNEMSATEKAERIRKAHEQLKEKGTTHTGTPGGTRA